MSIFDYLLLLLFDVIYEQVQFFEYSPCEKLSSEILTIDDRRDTIYWFEDLNSGKLSKYHDRCRVFAHLTTVSGVPQTQKREREHLHKQCLQILFLSFMEALQEIMHYRKA